MKIPDPRYGGTLDDVMLLIRTSEYKQEGEPPGWSGHQVRYWCEGCGYIHQIGVHREGEPHYPGGPSWHWNGDLLNPVLAPSQLHRTYNYPADGSDADKAEFDALPGTFDARISSRFGHVCHTFIGINGAPPGHVIFLADCRKAAGFPLAGQVRRLLPRREWIDSHWACIVETENVPDA